MRVNRYWLTLLGALSAIGAGPSAYLTQPAVPVYPAAARSETSETIAAARLAELEANVAALRSQLDNQLESQLSPSCVAPSCAPCCAPRPNAWLQGAYPSGWIAGYESVIVKPFFQSNEVITNLTGGGYNWNYEYTPRVWLGYVGESGLGARARYWQFDHTSGGALLDIDQGNGNFLTIATNNRLRLYTIDAEVTQRAALGRFLFNFAAGGRYVEFGNTINASLSAQGLTGAARLGVNFVGGGPTLAAEAWRPLFGGFALYGNGRASLLYGNAVTSLQSDVGNNPLGQQLRQATLLPIFETQLGLQWTKLLAGGATFFVRSGVEAQLWDGVGRLPNTFTNNNGGGGPNFVVFSDLGNLGFFGVTAAAGFAY